jgi:HAD superfamily hydrolase (TIGR01509 family)
MQQSLRHHPAKPNAKIKFVYFDMGNVMLSMRGSFKKLANYIGAPDDKLTVHWMAHEDDMARGTLLMQDYWNKLKKDFNYSGPDMKLSDYMASIHNPILEIHTLTKKLATILPIGLLTNIQKDMFASEKAHGHLPDVVFTQIIQSWEVGVIKPEREIYRLAHIASNVEAHEILFVDDLGKNIEQAVTYGMNGYHFDPDNAALSVEEISNILL